jgi:hypothetical protein
MAQPINLLGFPIKTIICIEPQQYRYVPQERQNHIAKTSAKLSNEGTGLH